MAASLDQRIHKNREHLFEAIEDMPRHYEYENDLDLHPSSDLHKKIVQEVCDRIRAAQAVTDKVHDEWRMLDHSLTAFVPASETEAKAKSKSRRNPVQIVIPMTFASQEMFLTYMNSVFLRDPIHQLIGRGSTEAKAKTALLERVLSTQNLWFKEGLHLDTLFRDGFRYNLGVAMPVWTKHRARKPIDEVLTDLLYESVKDLLPRGTKRGDIVRFMEMQTIFEGNKLLNIDPYKLILDPNATINDFQNSEYFGFMRRTNAMEGITREIDPEEYTFNWKYVRALVEQSHGRSIYWRDNSGRGERQELGDLTDMESAKPPYASGVDLAQMFMWIIPKEWQCGDQDYPVLYRVAVAADSVVVEFGPLELDHGMLPAAVCAPNSTGHDLISPSHAAVSLPMQRTIDWLVQSHVDNVRKAINDMLLVDGSKVHVEDLLNPGPGKLIRVKQSAYGQSNLDTYIKQLNVVDVTGNHMTDADRFMALINKTLGTEDIVAGDLSQMPERPTATGIQAAQQGALSRLQRLAEIIDMQAIQDLSYMEAFNTVQFMDRPVAVSILGKYEEQIRTEFGLPPGDTEYEVSPFDLAVNFQVVPRSGARPRQEGLQHMTALMQTMLSIEGVQQTVFAGIDVIGMFLQWSRKAGFEDVHEFTRATGGGVNMNVMPDGQVQQEVQAGNLVPQSQALGAA